VAHSAYQVGNIPGFVSGINRVDPLIRLQPTHDSWDDPPSGSFFVNQYVQAERNVPRIVKESTSYVTYEMAKSLKSIVYDPIKQSFGCQFESSQIEVYAIMYTTSLQLYRRKPKSGVPNMMFSGNFYDASNPFSKSRMACSTLK